MRGLDLHQPGSAYETDDELSPLPRVGVFCSIAKHTR